MRKTVIVESGPAVHRDYGIVMKIPSGDDESFEFEPMTTQTFVNDSFIEKPKIASMELLNLPEVQIDFVEKAELSPSLDGR
jgi:hypothetical protein